MRRRRCIRLVGQDFRKIFRDFREVKSCFDNTGFLNGMYKLVPDTHGYFGIFEQGRTYQHWIWKDLIPIHEERVMAFFRRRIFDTSALSSTLTPSNVVTLVFTDKQCHIHQEKNGQITSFYYDHIDTVKQKRQSSGMDIALENGQVITLPIMNEDLASYLLVLAGKKRHADWMDEQVEAGRKHANLLLSTLLASTMSLVVLVFFFRGNEPSGGDILLAGIAVYLPAQALAFVLINLYEMILE